MIYSLCYLGANWSVLLHAYNGTYGKYCSVVYYYMPIVTVDSNVLGGLTEQIRDHSNIPKCGQWQCCLEVVPTSCF